jgi:bacteriorhodopsin
MFRRDSFRTLSGDELETHRQWTWRVTLFYTGMLCVLVVVAIATRHSPSTRYVEAATSADPCAAGTAAPGAERCPSGPGHRSP